MVTRPYPDGLDVRAFDDDKHVAVVRVPPVLALQHRRYCVRAGLGDELLLVGLLGEPVLEHLARKPDVPTDLVAR